LTPRAATRPWLELAPTLIFVLGKIAAPALTRRLPEKAMFIQTEPTPNPATLKFLPGRPVLDEGALEFRSFDAASNCFPSTASRR
jgi:hypothetical protein